jgi:hypothetical protein
MKGYKVLLDELSLHNNKEIEKLMAKRVSLKKLIGSLCCLEDQANNVICEVSKCLREVENKTKGFISNLIVGLDDLVVVLNSKQHFYSRYHCSCGFLSDMIYEYSKHFAKCQKVCEEFSQLT